MLQFLPTVHPDTYHSLLASPCDTETLLLQIAEENPEVVRLLKVLETRGESITGALVLYRMLRAQAESDALEELFRYDP